MEIGHGLLAAHEKGGTVATQFFQYVQNDRAWTHLTIADFEKQWAETKKVVKRVRNLDERAKKAYNSVVKDWGPTAKRLILRRKIITVKIVYTRKLFQTLAINLKSGRKTESVLSRVACSNKTSPTAKDTFNVLPKELTHQVELESYRYKDRATKALPRAIQHHQTLVEIEGSRPQMLLVGIG